MNVLRMNTLRDSRTVKGLGIRSGGSEGVKPPARLLCNDTIHREYWHH